MNIRELLEERVFIIAEIGNNHNGDVNIAKKLIDRAVEAGADAVKFQTFRGIDIIAPNIPSSQYPEWNVTEYKYWYEFLDSISLPYERHEEVFEYALGKGVIPFSTPTSPESVKLLEKLDVSIFKVASMDLNNVQLLEVIASTNKPVILSTGMSSEDEIERAVEYFDCKKLALMHCVSNYPLDFRDANLKSIPRLWKRFGCSVGFSDHSLGYELDIAAVVLGARIIEKHITLDRNTPLKAEHHFAMEPHEFKEMVHKIRQIETSLGDEVITLSWKEKEMKKRARRSLYVNKNLKAGHMLGVNDISVVRPPGGAPPEAYKYFIGKRITHDKDRWTALTKEDLLLY